MGVTQGALNSVYEKEESFKDYSELAGLVRVLPFDVNLGYSDMGNLIITKVNGQKYKDFKDFVKKVQAVNSEFIVFETDRGEEIVLDVKQVQTEKAELMRNYNITSDMSDDVK